MGRKYTVVAVKCCIVAIVWALLCIPMALYVHGGNLPSKSNQVRTVKCMVYGKFATNIISVRANDLSN